MGNKNDDFMVDFMVDFHREFMMITYESHGICFFRVMDRPIDPDRVDFHGDFHDVSTGIFSGQMVIESKDLMDLMAFILGGSSHGS